MATHSSILAWRTPGTEEPAGLQPMGSQGVTRLSNQHAQLPSKGKVKSGFCLTRHKFPVQPEACSPPPRGGGPFTPPWVVSTSLLARSHSHSDIL